MVCWKICFWFGVKQNGHLMWFLVFYFVEWSRKFINWFIDNMQINRFLNTFLLITPKNEHEAAVIVGSISNAR